MEKLSTDLLCKSRDLRKNQSDAEKFLWRQLRNRAFCGFRFKRQRVFGFYIVDFYCSSSQLIIELDGGQHDSPKQREYDRQRTEYLKSLGLHVIRFWNHHVFLETDAVMQAIWNALNRHTLTLNPSPAGGRGEENPVFPPC